ncbi:prepilin-type N-terminal cleavage/methylation domain-containing protein [Geomonas subterranea]|uniref:Prepilin-type N-terminal cleavage/methylation domain-containing protein n=1 Tax=Geomonas subterranea TaxID=2847989 RepID=A0ABX8LHN1_9BACT|nr:MULTISPECIES: prepilin-type N-terminal cleavage/methylation domain-containing protein [Geomonas]QXE91477.1 prepilin-type N-terminal cleavage/methylation domain-containing protein [Geomonas subterranea]QXM10435.1 prepilin-type N-terminal cleavage/methylation domain-containing protein [Geomonas subterranea]
MLKGKQGYTLVELIVVMAIFTIVIVVASAGFKTVLTQVGQQSKLMETDIGSVVGLELFRSDLQSAGYGLPWGLQNTPAGYTEVTTTEPSGQPPTNATFWPSGQSARSYNDAAGVPRAVQSGNTTFNLKDGVGSQYLVLKSLSVAGSTSGVQRKWLSVSYDETNVKKAPNWNDPANIRNFSATDRVIVLRNTFSNNVPSRQLQVTSTGAYSTTFSNYTAMTIPHSSGDMFQVYGVDAATDLRMPFNRADYYVRTPAPMPPACAPNTGVLYKAVLKQAASGGFTEIPLLDCVADLQVVYGVGPSGTGDINFHQTTLPGTGSPQEIRQQLKEIRVYVLAQQGKKDPGYHHPNSQIEVGERFGGSLMGRTFDLPTQIGTGWDNYRWKVYPIVVRPQNLIQ